MSHDSPTMYSKLKSLQRHLEFLDIQVFGFWIALRFGADKNQEGYIKDEMKNLKRELIRAKEVRC